MNEIFDWQTVNRCLCKTRFAAENDKKRMEERHGSDYAKGYMAGLLTFETFFRDEILGRKNKIADSLGDCGLSYD